jgi:polyisoprenoid-binding protein YceI
MWRNLLALVTLALPVWAAEYSLELKPENTKIGWTLGTTLHTVEGTFSLKRGTITFDPDSGLASGQVVVSVVSGQSGSEARDQKMHANVLESSKYLDAVFVPDRFIGRLTVPGTSSLKLHGMLTLHGTAHELTMDIQAKAAIDRTTASITFDIPFVAWGMKDPSNFLFKVKKTVAVQIETSGTLQRR